MRSNVLYFLMFFIFNLCEAQTIFGPPAFSFNSVYDYIIDQTIPADVDNDGDVDVLFRINRGGLVTFGWYENLNGQGDFGDKFNIIGQVKDALGRKMRFADLDNDGDNDLVAILWFTNELVWFEHLDGQGNFSAKQTINDAIINSDILEVVNLNQDNIPDVLTSINDTIYWLQGVDGNGTFESPSFISGNLQNLKDSYCEDLDSDGDKDILIASQNDTLLTWFENTDGNGAFDNQIVLTDQYINLQNVRSEDIDGDNDFDVLACTSNGAVLIFYNLDANGTFSPSPVLLDTIFTPMWSFELADIDGDDDLDIVIRTLFDNILWYENTNGMGDFGEASQLDNSFHEISAIFIGDIDGDNDLDIGASTAGFSDNQLLWYSNEDGLGSFSPSTNISPAFNPGHAIVRDFDNDGDLDFLLENLLDDRILFIETLDFQNNEYRKDTILQLPTEHSTFQLVDLNGDTQDDILFSSSFPHRVSWVPNLGAPDNWGAIQQLEFPYFIAFDAHAVDLDGDGDNDIISSSQTGDQLFWYENLDGLGNFSELINIEADGGGELRITTSDLDNDGDQDIITSDLWYQKISWYENLSGQGAFGVEQVITENFGETLETQAADLDSDGDIDLVNGDAEGGQIFWLENDGAGNFGDRKNLWYPIPGITNIKLGDIDSDGDIDIFASAFNPSITIWLENLNGEGLFSVPKIISIFNMLSMDMVDIDMDQVKDLVFTSSNFGSIGWLGNISNNPRISGTLFYDQNENQIFDSNEFGILNQALDVQPNPIVNYSGLNGQYSLFVENGIVSIAPVPSPDWMLTTTPGTYSVDFQDSTIQNINFGFFPTESILEVTPDISSSPTRCGFQVPFWLTYTNSGTEFASGMVSLQLDPLVSMISVNPSPDSVFNNQLFWSFNNVPPTYYKTIDLVLEMPGPDQINTALEFIANTFVIDEQGDLILTNLPDLYNPVISCAYDPNDKIVEPAGITDENLTLIGEDLEYTIRFQNTGTDTAFNVRLEDIIDDDLDLASFLPLSGSHPYQFNIEMDTRKLVVEYKNILLPDSLTNEPLSHGFFKFRINHIEDIPDSTLIENTADIYFDFNPPIQTNTTRNIFVSEVPTNSVDELQMQISTFPNPYSAYIIIKIDTPDRSLLQRVDIRSVNGQMVQSLEIPISGLVSFESDDAETSGVYFYEVIGRDGSVLRRGNIVKQ